MTKKWRKAFFKKRFENSTSLVALIISFLVLLVSFWQLNEIREFNRLSIMPHLQVNPILTDPENSGLYLENAGTGTAFIDSLTISVDGKTFDLVEDDLPSLFTYVGVKNGCFKRSIPQKGGAIRSGVVLDFFKITGAKGNTCLLDMAKFLMTKNMKIDISYKTPYGETLDFSNVISIDEKISKGS